MWSQCIAYLSVFSVSALLYQFSACLSALQTLQLHTCRLCSTRAASFSASSAVRRTHAQPRYGMSSYTHCCLQVNVNKVWIAFSSIILGFSFMFGTRCQTRGRLAHAAPSCACVWTEISACSISNMYQVCAAKSTGLQLQRGGMLQFTFWPAQAVVFLFVVHPFDVGDALMVGHSTTGNNQLVWVCPLSLSLSDFSACLGDKVVQQRLCTCRGATTCRNAKHGCRPAYSSILGHSHCLSLAGTQVEEIALVNCVVRRWDGARIWWPNALLDQCAHPAEASSSSFSCLLSHSC